MSKQKIIINVSSFNKATKLKVLELFGRLGYGNINNHEKAFLSANFYANYIFPNSNNSPTDSVYWSMGYDNSDYSNFVTLQDLERMVPFELRDLQDRDEVYYRNHIKREVYKDVLLDERFIKSDSLIFFNDDLTHKMLKYQDIVTVIRHGEIIFSRDDKEREQKTLKQIEVMENELERLKSIVNNGS